jgi:cysteine-rich repeat protein
MNRWLVLALCAARLVLAAGTARGAAVLIPDHTHRLGSCGAGGGSCTWDCRDVANACEANGPSCPAPATCKLDATEAFRGVVSVKIDASSCATNGAVLTIGLAGTKSNGMTFQITDKVIDLCERSMFCTGREPRDCSACPGVCTDQCTDGSDCDCPPGPVVFMCKDPLATNDEFLRETDMAFVVNWLAGQGGSQTVQPLMELIRNELATEFPTATGRPVMVDASVQSLADFSSPSSGRFCVKVWFLRDSKPLGVCTNDPNRFCGVDGDCAGGGTCASGTPTGINPSVFTTVASGRKCSGSGRPCVTGTDCPAAQTCDATTASATVGNACSVAGTACTGPGDCPQFEDCVACASTLCGDGVVDPGEQCDDDNTTSGDGCSATCQNEGTACPATVDPACNDDFLAGSFAVLEKVAGKEKLVARFLQGPQLTPAAFGDPLAGTTAYHLCVYDDAGALVDDLAVDRAGDDCGGQPCWKGIGKPAGSSGFRYKDPALTADGVLLMLLRAGDAGKSKLIVRQKAPTGIAAALSGATAATVQLRASDAPAPSCFGMATSVVTRNDGLIFKAKTP